MKKVVFFLFVLIFLSACDNCGKERHHRFPSEFFEAIHGLQRYSQWIYVNGNGERDTLTAVGLLEIEEECVDCRCNEILERRFQSTNLFSQVSCGNINLSARVPFGTYNKEIRPDFGDDYKGLGFFNLPMVYNVSDRNWSNHIKKSDIVIHSQNFSNTYTFELFKTDRTRELIYYKNEIGIVAFTRKGDTLVLESYK